MNNKRKFKKIIALALVVLINVNAFAAVSGNDGSAFVTKAEFDSLVNAFNEQMDNYENTLQSKVDGAIANYLASLDDSETIPLDNYVQSARSNNIKNVQFMKFVTPQATKDVYDVIAGYAVYKAYGVLDGYNVGGSGIYGYAGTSNVASWNGSYADVKYTNFTGKTNDYISAYYFANFPKTKTDGSKDLTVWTLQDLKRKRLYQKLYSFSLSFASNQYTDKSYTAVNMNPSVNNTIDFSSLTQPSTFTPSAAVGTYYTMENVKPFSAQTHEWIDTAASTDPNNNKCLDYNLGGGTVYGDVSLVDYELRDYYDTKNPVTLQIQSKKEHSGTYNGGDPGSSCALMYQSNSLPNLRGTAGGSNGMKYNFKFNRPPIYSAAFGYLSSKYWNETMNRTIYKYNGIPITRVDKPGTVNLQITLNNASAGAYVYGIADKVFPNTAIPEKMEETISGVKVNRLLARGTVTRSGDEVLNFSFNKDTIYDKTNGDYLYIKIDPAVAGEIITVTVNSVQEVITSE